MTSRNYLSATYPRIFGSARLDSRAPPSRIVMTPVSVVEFGDDDVTGLEGVGKNRHGFLVQNYSYRATRARLEARFPFIRSRDSFVDPGGYLAVDQKPVAAVAQIAARPKEGNETSRPFFTIAKGFQTQMNVRARTGKGHAVDVSDWISVSLDHEFIVSIRFGVEGSPIPIGGGRALMDRRAQALPG